MANAGAGEGISESVYIGASRGTASSERLQVQVSMSMLFNGCLTSLTEFETFLISTIQARGGLRYKIPQSCCFFFLRDFSLTFTPSNL